MTVIDAPMTYKAEQEMDSSPQITCHESTKWTRKTLSTSLTSGFKRISASFGSKVVMTVEISSGALATAYLYRKNIAVQEYNYICAMLLQVVESALSLSAHHEK